MNIHDLIPKKFEGEIGNYARDMTSQKASGTIEMRIELVFRSGFLAVVNRTLTRMERNWRQADVDRLGIAD